MLYRTMPRADRPLSILGFGCMRLPLQADGTVDEPAATRILRHAIDAGVTYVDTAYPYHGGESEPVVGRALAGGYRERVQVATKLPSWLVRSRADMDRILDEQLARLRTDHIDYYLVHAVGGATWDRVERLGVRDFLAAARRDGRVDRIGFSSHDTTAGFRKVVDAYPWDFCQLQYNFLDETYQVGRAGLEYAAARGLGVVIMEPLRGGQLTRPIPAVTAVWAGSPVPRSQAAWALRWVWDHAQVQVVLSGMSDLAQVEENLRLADQGHAGVIDAAERALYARVRAAYRARVRVDCTGCAYCAPCAQGVNIPECFNAYNEVFAFDDPERARLVYGIRAGKGVASSCTACRDCVERCPQGIEIPDRLAEVAAYFGR
jgi:uncharacterized protein